MLGTYFFLLRTGMPLDKAKVWKRIARVLLAFVVYIAIEQLINPSVDLIGLEDNSFGGLVAAFIITFVSFVGTILIARRFKLYKTT